MANKDIYEMWQEGIESATQNLHAQEDFTDIHLNMVNGMMIRTGIRSGVENLGTLAVGTGRLETYGNAPNSSYESGACGSYASGACVSFASGACLASPAV